MKKAIGSVYASSGNCRFCQKPETVRLKIGEDSITVCKEHLWNMVWTNGKTVEKPSPKTDTAK